jgi:SAM-dependent methyltransferase
MSIIEKLRNILRGRLKAWAPMATKRKVWNREFAEGRWDYIDHTEGDCIYDYVAKYCRRGSILDLGCGSGNTGNELDAECYADYEGVDISDIAVQRASLRTKLNGRSGKNRYFQSDISAYVPTRKHDVVLFRESIWYIPHGTLKAVLDRYKNYLKESGVFVVRMHDREALAAVVALIRTDYAVIEEYLPNGSKDIVMVFR